MSSAPQINTGISHERLHALKLKPKAVQDPATHDASAQKVSQQATGLKWLDVSKNDKSLKTGDGVYLSVISSALSKDRVEAPVTSSAAPRVDLKQKLVNLGKDKLAKAAKDVSSFNFFVAEIAKNVLGAIRFEGCRLRWRVVSSQGCWLEQGRVGN